jgi:Xaa-Pro aminopeptidase
MAADRLTKLREKLAEQGLDGLLVSHPQNRRYLSGFTGSAGHLLVTQKATLIATDFRYYEQAAQQAPGFALIPVTSADVAGWLPALMIGLAGRKIGVEADHLTYTSYKQFSEVLRDLLEEERPKLTPTHGLVEGLRAVKEPREIAAIQAAVDLGDAAYAHLLAGVQPGWTEKQAAWEVEKHIREHGGEAVSFETIVAGGEWSALPHAYPRDRPLQEDEPVIVDLGARLDGYCSDMTRTLCLGEESERFRIIYDIVLAAQLAAEELIEAGMTGEQAHMLAHRVIEEAGYGDHFGHGLGHGVGLEVHEAPRLGRGSTDVLADGMVMTIEPGIYISGWGGVRIEDLAVMENGQLRVLTRAPKL